MARQFWLVKSEPSVFSISQFQKAKTTSWQGVRNYQARIHLRTMKQGDGVLFYHSSADVVGVAGLAEVSAEAYPDTTSLNKKSDFFDPRATRADPIWATVDLKWEATFPEVVTLERLRREPSLRKMLLLKKGNRLSVFPITEAEFKRVAKLGQG